MASSRWHCKGAAVQKIREVRLLALTNSMTFADYGGERSRCRDSQLRDALSDIPFGNDSVGTVD